MLQQSLPASESTPQTFRTFVTEPATNGLAYNTALRVARTPGTVYNPLYITGEPGMGKTHLLRAIEAYLRTRLNGAEVILTSGDAFSQDFINHLRRGHMLAFRRRYRRAGALLIDGIAVLAGRETAAEELVHTLDALREAGRQIVIADDQRPANLRGIPERLRSRLGASLVVGISAPNDAARLVMLRQKCVLWSISVEEEVLLLLASRIRGSVRDLESALQRLVHESISHAEESPLTLALQIVADVNRESRQPRGRAQVDAVIQAVCDYYGLARQVLLGKSREMTVAQARQVAMYLLREDAGLTATQVGQELGRDHSTVLHGHARIATALVSGDSLMSLVLDNIRKTVVQQAQTSLG